jgi:SAM-dependent methyltransferase
MSNFQKYAAYYDLIYRDKDYAAEAEYVARLIRSSVPTARTILELGSGTGRHGRLLAAKGFDVHGIERSAEMVASANAGTRVSPGRFTCEVGDVCSVNVGRIFDAVISLFHVVSYQASDEALQAVFEVAAAHLGPGGVFLFDVWHGPAVVSQGSSDRVKELADDRHRVQRTCRPQLDSNRNTVTVVYDFECEDRLSGQTIRFDEEHVMRYLFPDELNLIAERCGLRQLRSEEFFTAQPPSPSTWSVLYLFQR